MTKAIPNNCLFSDEHEWIRLETNHVVMGISEYAQASLGDVVYVELPSVGKEITKGQPIGVVESVKAVSDIFAPISGTVLSVNQDVLDNPEKINQEPYNDGWLITITVANQTEIKALMSAAQYEDMLMRIAK